MGLDEALQQRALVGAEVRGRRAVGRALGQLLAQRRAGALQRAVGGGHGRVEQRGGLGGRPVEHVAQDEHGPLLRGQQLDDGEEGQLDGLAGDDHRVGLGVAGATSSSSRSG